MPGKRDRAREALHLLSSLHKNIPHPFRERKRERETSDIKEGGEKRGEIRVRVEEAFTARRDRKREQQRARERETRYKREMKRSMSVLCGISRKRDY